MINVAGQNPGHWGPGCDAGLRGVSQRLLPLGLSLSFFPSFPSLSFKSNKLKFEKQSNKSLRMVCSWLLLLSAALQKTAVSSASLHFNMFCSSDYWTTQALKPCSSCSYVTKVKKGSLSKNQGANKKLHGSLKIFWGTGSCPELTMVQVLGDSKGRGSSWPV